MTDETVKDAEITSSSKMESLTQRMDEFFEDFQINNKHKNSREITKIEDCIEDFNKEMIDSASAALSVPTGIDCLSEEDQKILDDYRKNLNNYLNNIGHYAREYIEREMELYSEGLLADFQISELCKGDKKDKMIHPFRPHLVRKCKSDKLISFGVSSVGYDSMLPYEFKVMKDVRNPDGSMRPIDPKNVTEDDWELVKVEKNEEGPTRYVINPGELILSRTAEYFRMPRDVMAICLGKSTYARTGLIVNVTPLEPGWHGNVTLELHNCGTRPIYIYPGEGICQFLFFRTKDPKTSYADRKGKYQGQRGITVSKV